MSSTLPNIASAAAKDPYLVSALIKDGAVDASTSTVSGKLDSKISGQKKELGKMDFLTLLTKQLQFQDPLSPTSNTDFIAQLAQFSALEGTNNVSDSISNLDKSFKSSLEIQNFNAISMNNSASVSLIGKRIRIRESSVTWSGQSQPVPLKINLGSAKSAVVNIVDKDGKVVKSLQTGMKDLQNSSTVLWDGTNDSGIPVQNGKYTIKIAGEEENSALYCFIEDAVQGIRYTDTGPMVKISGTELPIGNILDVAQSDTANKQPDNSQMLTNGLNLLGKNVRYKDTNLTYIPGKADSINMHVNLGGFSSAVVQVVDSNGNVVNSIKVNANQDKNTAEFSLDCVDYNGNGPYKIRLADNNSAYFYSEGPVKGITTKDGVLYVKVNGMELPASQLLDVSLPTAEA